MLTLLLILSAPPVRAVADGPVILLLDAAGTPTGRLVGHGANVTSVALFPDGLRAVSGSRDGQVRLWNLSTMRGTRAIYLGEGPINAVVPAPDGDSFAVATPLRAHHYDASTGFRRAFLRPERDREALALAFSRDSRTLAVAHAGNEVILYELLTGSVRARHPGRNLSFELQPFAPQSPALAWETLDSRNGELAYRALWSLILSPRGRALMLHELKDVAAEMKSRRDRITRLIADLDAESFEERENATAELARLGPDVYDDLHKALEKKPPLETVRRLERLLNRMKRPVHVMPLGQLRRLRAVEALEAIATPEARTVLERLATAEEEPLRAAARATLGRMKK